MSQTIRVRKEIRDKLEQLLVPSLEPDTKAMLLSKNLKEDENLRKAIPLARLRQSYEFLNTIRTIDCPLINFDQSAPSYVSRRKKVLTADDVSEEEDDLPTIHVIFNQESNEQLTIDTTTRQRSFDFTVSVYVNSRIEVQEGGTFADVVFGNAVRILLLDYLEDLSYDIDRVMVKRDFGQINYVTNFDLSTVDYSIDKEIADGQYLVGVLSLNYDVEYVYTYEKD